MKTHQTVILLAPTTSWGNTWEHGMDRNYAPTQLWGTKRQENPKVSLFLTDDTVLPKAKRPPFTHFIRIWSIPMWSAQHCKTSHSSEGNFTPRCVKVHHAEAISPGFPRPQNASWPNYFPTSLLPPVEAQNKLFTTMSCRSIIALNVASYMLTAFSRTAFQTNMTYKKSPVKHVPGSFLLNCSQRIIAVYF